MAVVTCCKALPITSTAFQPRASDKSEVLNAVALRDKAVQILASPVARKQLLLFDLIDGKAERAIDERRQLRKVAHDLITRRQPCRNVRIFSDIEVRPSWFSGFSEASATGEAMLIGVETRRKSTMAAVVGRAVSKFRTVNRCRASGTMPGMRSTGITPVEVKPCPVEVSVVFRSK